MSDCDHQNDVLIASIDKGKKVIKSITDFCRSNRIEGAWISGIGALSEATLALYDLDKKKYIKKTITEPLEICVLNGNMAMTDSKHLAHIHIVVSNSKMQTFGGHLEEAVVAATCELKIEIFDHCLTRKFDPEIGLNLIQIG